MNRIDAVKALMPFGNKRVADVYDDNDIIGDAFDVLIPGFEYPNISHLLVKEVVVSFKHRNGRG